MLAQHNEKHVKWNQELMTDSQVTSQLWGKIFFFSKVRKRDVILHDRRKHAYLKGSHLNKTLLSHQQMPIQSLIYRCNVPCHLSFG